MIIEPAELPSAGHVAVQPIDDLDEQLGGEDGLKHFLQNGTLPARPHSTGG